MDESGLYIKQVPNQTLAPKEVTSVSGTKKQRKRVSIAATCNADGSMELPLMFIGKSKNPRCLKSYDKDKLPVFYCNQSKAWMDKILFEQWFVNQFVPEVKTFLKSKNLPLKALLLVANCKAHKYLKVDDIQVEFLPPNVTSLIQPLDQDILQAFKLNYQTCLVDSILKAQANGTSYIDFLKSITVKEAVFWSAQVWDKIESATIKKCWDKLWPIEKRDAATQTEDDNACNVLNLDMLIGAETAVDLSNSNRIDELLQLIKKIKGYETIDKKTISEWLKQKSEPAIEESCIMKETAAREKTTYEFDKLNLYVESSPLLEKDRITRTNFDCISSSYNGLLEL